MTLQFRNTLTRRTEPFVPLAPGRAGIYTCGPTVYDHAHLGNLRTFMFEDLLVRHLAWRGFAVFRVMNLTDVDDKTIRGAREAGLSLDAFTRPFKDAFFADLETLRIRPADVYPAATDHTEAMIGMIGALIERGHAYQAGDGSVYFRIESFPEYGKLARIDRAGLKPGARVDQDEYEKEQVGDFALWKAWTEKDGDVAWDSPWGRGRPGWHIECSAMSTQYLGPTFDIHCGGVDNLFPHHEDEIAQSECCTGKPFVRYWLHSAHLIVEGRKMSKSEGNFFTLPQILDQGWTGREVRYLLLSTHYRQQLNFTFDGLKAARTSLHRLDELRRRLEDRAGDAEPGGLPGFASARREAFGAALDDDLNISGALGHLFDLVREANTALDHDGMDPPAAAAVRDLLTEDLDHVLAVMEPDPSETGGDADLEALLERRNRARAERNWAEADRLRDHLADLGWKVQDGPDGSRLVKI